MGDPPHQGVGVGVIDVTAGELRFDCDGTHVLDGHLRPIRVANQDAVLIDLMSLHINKSLADRFDEPDLGEAFLRAA